MDGEIKINLPKIITAIVGLIFCAVTFACLSAEELTDTPISQIMIPLDERAINTVNEFHSIFSEQIVSVSDSIDNFFVSERMEDEGSKTKVILGYLSENESFRGTGKDFLLRARFHLPKTENKLRLVINNSFEDDADQNPTGSSLVDQESTTFNTALQFVIAQTDKWQLSSQFGVRFGVPLDPIVRFRIRRLFFLSGVNIRLTQSFLWLNSEGWSEISGMDVEKKLQNHYFFRSSTRMKGIKKTDNLKLSQRFSIFDQISKKQMLIYSMGMSANLNLPATAEHYFSEVHYRANFYKKWAFYDVVPSVNYFRSNHFNMSVGILFKLDIVFG